MDVSKTFESVLDSVKNSSLNFMITRTPFSATICLKRSFIKNKVDETVQNTSLNKDFNTLEKQVEILERKVNETEQERSRFEKLYNEEKLKVKKAAESDGQFRADLLRVKSEKRNLSSELKSVEVKCDYLEKKIKRMEEDNKELAAKLENKAQSLGDYESKNEELTKERDCSEIMLENLISKVQDLQNQIKQSNPCPCCEKTFENRSELTVHMHSKHSKSQETQIDDTASPRQVASEKNLKESAAKTFEEYNCFYCHRTVNSKAQLQSHKKVCHAVCRICDAQCSDESDLQFHMYEYHTWTVAQYLCSQCPTNFRRIESLQSHRKYAHGICKQS